MKCIYESSECKTGEQNFVLVFIKLFIVLAKSAVTITLYLLSLLSKVILLFSPAAYLQNSRFFSSENLRSIKNFIQNPPTV